MRNKIILIVIILLGMSSTIFPQNTYRKAIFLHRSVGANVYGPNGSNTSVPAECEAYNTAHNYTGTDAVSMDEVLFPWNGGSGNAWWCWREVFDGTDPDDDIYQYINAYDIIIIKTCYTIGIPVYWYYGPADTLDPVTQSYYNYQWHCRYIVNKMGTMPDKFFVMWTPAMFTPENAPNGYPLGEAFAYWMTDTLAAGIDPIYNSRYGAFPENVHMYDHFNNADSLTYLPLSLAVSPTDNHLSAEATELLAPLFVNDVFDAAIAFESRIMVNCKVLLQGPYNGSGAMTTTLNNNNLLPVNSNEAYSTSVYSYTASNVGIIPNTDIVDWVLIELRTGTDSGTRVGTRAAFLKSDGTIVDVDGTSPVLFTGLSDGNYYIVVRHRNHLAVMTANPVTLSFSPVLYNFTTAQTQAYGSNAEKDLGGGVFGMYSGNGNGDGFISASDKNIIWFPQNGFSGYLKGDFNLNGFVTAGDKNLFWFTNNGLSSQVP